MGRAQKKAFDSWLRSLPKKARLAIVEVGAGTTVPTIRFTAQDIASRFRKPTLIRINLEDGYVPASLRNKSVSIEGVGVLEALTRLDALLQSLANRTDMDGIVAAEDDDDADDAVDDGGDANSYVDDDDSMDYGFSSLHPPTIQL